MGWTEILGREEGKEELFTIWNPHNCYECQCTLSLYLGDKFFYLNINSPDIHQGEMDQQV